MSEAPATTFYRVDCIRCGTRFDHRPDAPAPCPNCESTRATYKGRLVLINYTTTPQSRR